jgi:acylphosphatase
MFSRYRIFVYGHVQGVFFRAFAKKCALLLGIRGWAKNLPDGRVEILVEGREHDLKEFMVKLKVGPDSASVEAVESDEENFLNEFQGFEII